MGKRARASPQNSTPSSSHSAASPSPFPETQFQPGSLDDDSQEGLWEALEILDERGPAKLGQYLIRWAGTDPATGKDWKPTWEDKTGCTNTLIAEWKERKAKGEASTGWSGKQEAAARGKGKRKRETNTPIIVSDSPEKPEKKTKRGKARGSTGLLGKPDHVPKPSPARSSASTPASPAPIARAHPARTVSVELSPRGSGRAEEGAGIAANAEPATDTRLTVHFEPGTTPPPSAPAATETGEPDKGNGAVADLVQGDAAAEDPPPRRLGPVPQPAPEIFHPYLAQTQATVDSQLDPISQFSSPRQATQQRAAAPRPASKIVVMDGQEMIVADSDSESDAEEAAADPAGDDGAGAVEEVVAALAAADSDSDDEEMDAALEAAMDAAESNAESTPMQCQWGGCGTAFHTARELAGHVRGHADEVAPEAEASPVEGVADPAGSPPTASPLVPETIPAAQAPEPALPEPAAAAPAVLAQLEAQVAEQAELVATLKDGLAEASRKVKASQEESEFLRANYATARDRAVEAVKQNDAARQTIKTLRGQLDIGLKQRDLHHTAVAAQAREEAARLKIQHTFLLEQSRRTDDSVRQRAADYTRVVQQAQTLVERVEELKEALETERAHTAALQGRNTDLSEQVAHIRALSMGAFDDDEDDEGEEDDGEPLTKWEERGAIEAYRCKWDAGRTDSCTRIFTGADEFVAHARSHLPRL